MSQDARGGEEQQSARECGESVVCDVCEGVPRCFDDDCKNGNFPLATGMSGILNSPSPVVPEAHRDAPSAAVRTERRPSAHLAWPKAKDGPSRTPSSQEQWMPEILEVRSKKQNLVRRCVRTTPSTGDSMGQIIRAPTSAERRNCKSRVEKTRGGN